MKNIQNTVVIGSGKGGVGKSTFSVNLSVSLAKKGLKVGLLDADIYGPSIPKMLDIKNKPDVDENKKIMPFIKYGIKSISIGNLIDPDKPVIWRGAMVVGALQQLLKDINWGDLDYLIIDLPPGTGDIQLSLSQSINLAGSIIISTPQDVSLIDVRRAINMFKRVNVDIIGLVENMSFFEISNEKIYIFGKDGVKEEAERQSIPFLGQIPIIPKISELADKGVPAIEQNSLDKSLNFDLIREKFLINIEKINNSKKTTKLSFEE